MRGMRHRGGTALLVVIAFLSILVVIVASLARLAGLERSATRAHGAAIEARWTAEAGLERAVAALRDLAVRQAHDGPAEDWIYRGEDFDGDGRWDGRREDSFANDRLDLADCPVEYALRPSFARFAGGSPIVVDRAAISGRLDDAAGRGTDRVYTLKILDCAAQVDVNGGLGSADEARRIARRIDRVWERIRTGSERVPAVGGVGEWLVARRPPGGYAGEGDVRRALQDIDPSDPASGIEVFRLLAPHVTCHPWRDATAVVPRGRERSGAAPSVPPAGSDRGEQVVADRLVRYDALERCPRAPVNVNTASTAVLYASLADLSGWVYLEGIRYHRDPDTGLPRWGDERPDALESPDLYEVVRLDRDAALRLAERLVEHRGERGAFRDWSDFTRFLDERTAAGELSPWQAALVRAQANPDTRFAKRNPDAASYEAIDKTDLIEWTTELCFSSMGRYEIESYARVLDADARVLASAKVEAVARVYDVLRDTTAADFDAGRCSPQFGRGPALAVLPEPDAGADRTYDGLVGLATTRPAMGRTPSIYASFDPRDPAWSGGMRAEDQVLPAAGPLVGPPTRGHLFVDGVYAERGVYPSYSSQGGSLSAGDGVIAFWYKPNWDIVSPAPRPHSILDLNGDGDGSTFQVYNDTKFAGDYAGGRPRSMLRFLGWDVGNGRTAFVEVDLERVTGPREWIHVTLRWSPSEIVLSAKGSRGSRSEGILPEYMFDSRPLKIVETNGLWQVVPDAEDIDADFFHGKNPPGWQKRADRSESSDELRPGEARDPTRGGCGRVIPWPGGSPWFESRQAILRFLESLLVDGDPRRDARSRHYHSILSDDGEKADRGKFRRLGPSPLVGTGSYFTPGTEPIRFLFEEDPTASLRLGGGIKLEVAPSAGGEPPVYRTIEAPSNGTYGDLVVYRDVSGGDGIESELETIVAQGRYYKEGDAVFESRPLGLAGRRIGSVAWQADVPPGSAGLRLELGGRVLDRPGACGIGEVLEPGTDRYRVQFLDRRAPDEPLFASPFLDSVTLTVLSRVQYLEWRVLGDGPPLAWTGERAP